MPISLKLTDLSIPQSWILQDASPFNDGVMTALQAAQLADVVSSRPLIPHTIVDLVDTVTKPLIVVDMTKAPDAARLSR